MFALILTSLLYLPLFPLNPVEEDTVAAVNMHLSAGLRGPGSVLGAGPTASARYEVLIMHPVVLRVGGDYNYGRTISNSQPRGPLHSVTVAFDGLYYRGTDRLTGYVGLGIFYSACFFEPSRTTRDSLFANYGVTDVTLGGAPGFRLTLGLRLRRHFSMEILVSEVRPSFRYRRDESGSSFSQTDSEVRLSDFRLSFGYLIPLRRN